MIMVAMPRMGTRQEHTVKVAPNDLERFLAANPGARRASDPAPAPSEADAALERERLNGTPAELVVRGSVQDIARAVEAAGDAARIDAIEQAEIAERGDRGPRQGVLRAVAAQREALGIGAEGEGDDEENEALPSGTPSFGAAGGSTSGAGATTTTSANVEGGGGSPGGGDAGGPF